MHCIKFNCHLPTLLWFVCRNVVTSFDVGCTLDLKKIAEVGWHVEYNPGKFNAVTMRIRQPRATCLIFSSGKLNCSGTKSEKDARKASRKFARILQKIANPEVFCI